MERFNRFGKHDGWQSYRSGSQHRGGHDSGRARRPLEDSITVDVKGEILELKNTINTMVDQLSSFAAKVTRVAREVGSEGQLAVRPKSKGLL